MVGLLLLLLKRVMNRALSFSGFEFIFPCFFSFFVHTVHDILLLILVRKCHCHFVVLVKIQIKRHNKTQMCGMPPKYSLPNTINSVFIGLKLVRKTVELCLAIRCVCQKVNS